MTSVEERLRNQIDPREFDTPEFQRDPFPLYKRLRDHHPLYTDRFHNRWVVSRYEDVVSVFQNNEGFDRGVYDPSGPHEFGKNHVFGPNILEYGNSEEHRFLRNIVADQFVGKRLESYVPVIEQIARELTDKMSAKAAEDIAKDFANSGEVELVSQFTTQFPIRVISNLLGLPRHDEDTFVRWYQALIEGLGFGGEHLAAGMAARDQIWDYMDPIIAERTKNPGDDLVSRFINAELDGKRLSVDEIKGFITLALAGGGDTTDKAISNMWYHMLYTRPDQFENEVKKDPELWSNVFTETMRYDPVVHAQGRRTTREIEMHGKVIPECASVTLYMAAATRDERVFKDPDTFDIFRDDVHMGREIRSGHYMDGKPGHLAFGMGQHFCMGYAAARQESIIASTRLFEAMKNPRPKFAEHEGVVAPSIDSGGFRSPKELWIKFDVA
ncbi:MAG TPA: cytochrome P450 [Dehalococcoidia bacterium]|nr:cytochrome P450 [Dehalococcoidia bacterium]